MAEIIHALNPRKPGKYNPHITLCNKTVHWNRKFSNDPEVVTCPTCKKRLLAKNSPES